MSDPFFNFPDGIQKFLEPGAKAKVQTFNSYKCRKSPSKCPSWDDVNCLQFKASKLFLKSKCGAPSGPRGTVLHEDDPGRYKVFVKGFKNLYEYAEACASGKVDYDTHMLLGKFVSMRLSHMPQTLRDKDPYVINHNEDVDTLHFKFACSGRAGGKTCGYERR
mgnify:CR=1 FL=1